MKALKEWFWDRLTQWCEHRENPEAPEEKRRRKEQRRQWEQWEENRRREKEEREQYIQNRRDERRNKQAIPLTSDSQTNNVRKAKLEIWLKPETVDFLGEHIGTKSRFSLIFLHSLYPKKASDYGQIIVPYDIALDIAEGAEDMDIEDEKEPRCYTALRERCGIVLCHDDSSDKNYLLLSSEDDSEPKIVVVNTILETDRAVSSSSFCCPGMKYLSCSEHYKGIVLFADAKIVEQSYIF